MHFTEKFVQTKSRQWRGSWWQLWFFLYLPHHGLEAFLPTPQDFLNCCWLLAGWLPTKAGPWAAFWDFGLFGFYLISEHSAKCFGKGD